MANASLHPDARALEASGAPAFVDAPVSGGVPGAAAATLTFMVRAHACVSKEQPCSSHSVEVVTLRCKLPRCCCAAWAPGRLSAALLAAALQPRHVCGSITGLSYRGHSSAMHINMTIRCATTWCLG